MRQKVGTILDDTTLRRLKEWSAREGRPMSEIINQALASYFEGRARKTPLKLAAVERLCSRPFKFSNRTLAAILEDDYFDQ